MGISRFVASDSCSIYIYIVVVSAIAVTADRARLGAQSWRGSAFLVWGRGVVLVGVLSSVVIRVEMRACVEGRVVCEVGI